MYLAGTVMLTSFILLHKTSAFAAHLSLKAHWLRGKQFLKRNSRYHLRERVPRRYAGVEDWGFTRNCVDCAALGIIAA